MELGIERQTYAQNALHLILAVKLMNKNEIGLPIFGLYGMHLAPLLITGRMLFDNETSGAL
jgi:hypothetical protein